MVNTRRHAATLTGLAGLLVASLWVGGASLANSGAKDADRILADPAASVSRPLPERLACADCSGAGSGLRDRADAAPSRDVQRPDGMLPPGPPPGLPPGPLALAALLSAAETYIGIEPGQLEAWRAFTNALIALPPPGPPPRPAPGDPVAFGQTTALAQRLVADGQAGAAVLKATELLKATLTSDQLARAAKLGPLLPPPPPPPRGGPPPHGMPPSRP